jgi:hypothetical protein
MTVPLVVTVVEPCTVNVVPAGTPVVVASGNPVAVGDGLGLAVGEGLGDVGGTVVGLGLGELVGEAVGDVVGELIGLAVGELLGVGEPVGLPVGDVWAVISRFASATQFSIRWRWAEPIPPRSSAARQAARCANAQPSPSGPVAATPADGPAAKEAPAAATRTAASVMRKVRIRLLVMSVNPSVDLTLKWGRCGRAWSHGHEWAISSR